MTEDPYSLPEWRAWVRAIREQPDCDNLRLICADWLDEHGESERAELIRVQCSDMWGVPCEQIERPLVDMGHPDIEVGCTTLAHPAEPPHPEWCPQCQNRQRAANIVTGYEVSRVSDRTLVFHQVEPPGDGRTGCLVHWWVRGFVELVKGPLSVLVGGESCRGGCDGTGMAYIVGKDGRRIGGGMGTWAGPTRGGWPIRECRSCHGTGQTAGILRDLLRVEPVTEVEVTGVEPVQIDCDQGRVYNLMRGRIDQRSPHFVGPELFDRLELPVPTVGGEPMDAKFALSPQLALAAINRAAYEHCLEPVGVTS